MPSYRVAWRENRIGFQCFNRSAGVKSPVTLHNRFLHCRPVTDSSWLINSQVIGSAPSI